MRFPSGNTYGRDRLKKYGTVHSPDHYYNLGRQKALAELAKKRKEEREKEEKEEELLRQFESLRRGQNQSQDLQYDAHVKAHEKANKTSAVRDMVYGISKIGKTAMTNPLDLLNPQALAQKVAEETLKDMRDNKKKFDPKTKQAAQMTQKMHSFMRDLKEDTQKPSGLSNAQLFARGAGKLVDAAIPFGDPIQDGLVKDLPNWQWLQDTFAETDNKALNLTDGLNALAGNFVPGAAAYKAGEKALQATSGVDKLARGAMQAQKATGAKVLDEAQKGAIAGNLWSLQDEVGKMAGGRSEGFQKATQNMLIDTLLGGVADPVLMGMLGGLKGPATPIARNLAKKAEVPELPSFDNVPASIAEPMSPRLDLSDVPSSIAEPLPQRMDLDNVPTTTAEPLAQTQAKLADIDTRLAETEAQLKRFDETVNVRRGEFIGTENKNHHDQMFELSNTIKNYERMLKVSEKDHIQSSRFDFEKSVADAEMQWDSIKELRRAYKEIRASKENKFRIPTQYKEEFGNIVPRSFIRNDSSLDIFAAAEAHGFRGDHEGALEFAHYLRELQNANTIRKKDLMPELPEHLTPENLRAEYLESDGAKGLNEIIERHRADLERMHFNPPVFEHSQEYREAMKIRKAIEDQMAKIQKEAETSQLPEISSTEGTELATMIPENVSSTAMQKSDLERLANITSTEKHLADTDAHVRAVDKEQQQTKDDDSPIAREEKKSVFSSLKELPSRLKKGKDRLKYDLVSDSQPAKDVERAIAKLDTDSILKRTSHGDIVYEDSMFKALRSANRSSRISAEWVEKGYGPIYEALNKAKIKHSDFEEYVLAKHAADILKTNAEKASEARKLVTELMTTAIDSPRAREIERALEDLNHYYLPEQATPEWIAKTLKKYENNKDMHALQKRFVEEQREDLKLYQKTGRYSKEQVDAMIKEHPNYISLRREIEELSEVRMSRGTGSTKARVGSPIKARKQGSLDKVLPPLESAMYNRVRAVDTAMKNDALKKVEKLFKVKGADDYFMPLDENTPYFAEIPKVEFYVNGEVQHYQVPDEMARMFENMNQRKVDSDVLKAIENLAVFSKKGMTHYNPKFLVKAPVRDTINALFTSRTGMNPIDVTAGFLDAVAGKQLNKLTGGKFKTYNEVFKDMGGDFSSFISMDMKDIHQVQKAMEKGTLGKGFNVLNPFKQIERFGAAMERGPRLAEFRSAKKAGYSDEGALFEATDVIDYADLGNLVRKLNDVSPYLGAVVRGNIRVAQAFKENPVKAITRGTMYITLPTIANYSLRFASTTNDEQRSKIQNMPAWQKNLFWAVPDPRENSNTVFLMPKGFFVTQIFANPVERALDQVYGDKQTDKKLIDETVEDFKNALMPPTVVAGISTLQEIARNHDDFLGMPIVSEEMGRKDKKDQYDSYTSEVAKTIGKLMGLSPAKVDHFIKGTTGGLGKDLLDLIDNTAAVHGNRPATIRPNEEILNPFAQFSLDERGSSKYSNELYEARKEEDYQKSQIRSEFKDQTGMTLPSDERGLSQVGDYNELFREINNQIKGIREDTNMTPEEKKNSIIDLRNEQRRLGTQASNEGVLANHDQYLEGSDTYLRSLGTEAKPTKSDIREVIHEHLISQGYDRQQVRRMLDDLETDQLVFLLEQLNK